MCESFKVPCWVITTAQLDIARQNGAATPVITNLSLC